MKAGLPANPRQMAHTMLDFPVPLAPIIIFKWGPGDTSQTSYVLNYKQVRLLSRDYNVSICVFLSFTPSGIYLGAMDLRIQVFQHFWKILSHSFFEYCLFLSPLFSFNYQVSILISLLFIFSL